MEIPMPGRGSEASGVGDQHGCPGWQLTAGLAAMTASVLVPKLAAIEASVSSGLMT
jgi:hypothetical protein